MSPRAVTPVAAAPVAALAPVQRPMLQRKCDCGQHTGGGECEECKKKKKETPLQRRAEGWGAPTIAPPIVHDVLSSAGQPLDSGTRALMESRFRRDFSQVRVHTDERSAESARAVSAHAYTVGRHVVFGAGRYAPQTTSGRALLSHELTHVAQQADAPFVGSELRIGEAHDAAEREAAAVEKTEAGGQVRVDQASQPQVQGSWDWGGAGWGTLIGGGAGVLAGGIALAAGSPLAGLAILGGGLLAGFLIGGLVGGDPTKIEHPPDCGKRQLAIIGPAMKEAAELVSKALARFGAYKTAPTDKANQLVHDQLMARFHSDTSETVGKIERVLSTMKGRFSSGDLKPECHAAEGVCAPPFDAYVHDAHTVVFCPSFFEDSQAALTIVHEMSHALVGGPQIRDRGYEGERIFKRLSTDEALTNAESYAEFVVDIATGNPVPAVAPEDNVKDDCPEDWREPVRAAVAKAERWTTNAINIFASKANAGYWTTLEAKYLPAPPAAAGKGPAPTPDKDLERALAVYRAANKNFANPIHFVCQPKGGSPCDKGGSVAWLGSNSKFFICAEWKAKNADDQVVSMLAGLYGYLAGLDDAAWRTGLARIAYEVTQKDFKVPAHSAIVGSAAWTTDQLAIYYTPTVPVSAAKSTYLESGTTHERQSKDVPLYAGTQCEKSALPFKFDVAFSVDSAGKERPGPYQAPRVAVEYSLDAPGSTVQGTDRDPETTPPREAGYALATKLKPVDVQLDQNGPFHIKITLEDPDSGVTRIYEDVIQVLAVRPCDMPDRPKGTPPGMDPSKRGPGKQKGESALA